MKAKARTWKEYKWWQWPLLVVLAPFVLPVVLIVLVVVIIPIGLWSMAAVAFQARRGIHQLRRVMTNEGRVKTWDQVVHEAAEGKGTIILDSRTVGWNWVDVWWTSDVVSAAGGPCPPPRDDPKYLSDHPFYQWAEEKYLRTPGGQASWVESSITHLGRRRLQQRIAAIRAQHPAVGQVNVLSAVAAMARRADSGAARTPRRA